MKIGRGMEKVVDIIGEILAFFTVILIVLLSINRFVGAKMGTAGFLGSATDILESIREIAVLLVVGLAGLEFALKRGLVIFIIYAVLVAVAVVFLFFPGVLPATHALIPLKL